MIAVSMDKEAIRYRFFKNLVAAQRLAVFQAFGVCPDDVRTPLTHELERRMLNAILNLNTPPAEPKPPEADPRPIVEPGQPWVRGDDKDRRLNVVQGEFRRQVRQGLAEDLRAMADAAERGEVNELVATYVQDGHYQYLWAGSLQACVFMAALIDRKAMDNCIAGGWNA